VGAAFTVLEHASNHVGGQLPPLHARIRFRERVVHAIRGTVLASRQRAFQHQCFHAFDDDAAAHLDGGGGADWTLHDVETHPIGRQNAREFRRPRAVQQDWHPMIPVRDRRHDRAFDETTGPGANGCRDLLLRRRRYRIQIHVEMSGGQIAGEAAGCVVRRCGGHDGKDQARMFGKRAGRFHEACARLCRTGTNAVVFGAVRCLDVEGDERRRARAAKAAREVEACFAKTKESNDVHGAELTPSRG